MGVVAFHVPVLADEVERLASERTRVVDCTAGGGGHTAVFCNIGARVLALDRDPDAIQNLLARFGDAATVLHGHFGDPAVLGQIDKFGPELVFLDLGVSSHQLDRDDRGFTFRRGVRLDMRMDPAEGTTAADLLNEAPEGELLAMFRDYGDERRAPRLVREILRRRRRHPFVTSDDLVNAIRASLGPQTGPSVFARLFQAVRIVVNEELMQLERALPALLNALVVGGDLAVITYHSGEDRLVKQAFRGWARACICPPRQPICNCRGQPLGKRVGSRPVTPRDEEIAANPRARSAKLRVFRKGPGA